MNHYMIHYPRNFANEYTIYVGTSETLKAVEAYIDSRPQSINGHVRRIFRKQAVRLGISRVHEAKRYGEQWFGGFAETGNNYATDIGSVIADAVEATEQFLLQASTWEDTAFTAAI